MYIYNKANCTEGFVGMVHGLAIFAALTNGWALEFVPTEYIRARLEDETIVNIAPNDAPHLFKLIDEWRSTTPRSLRERAANERLAEAIDEHVADSGYESAVSDFYIRNS